MSTGGEVTEMKMFEKGGGGEDTAANISQIYFGSAKK